MNRTAWLAAVAFLLAPGATFAQFGGMGGGMGGMGGRMGGSAFGAVRHAVQVELEGGRRVSGQIDFRALTIYSDLGQHTIQPDKIKMIRFLKPADPPKDDENGEAPPQAARRINDRQMLMQMQMQQQMMAGGGMVNLNNGGNMPMVRAKVTLTTGEEIIGNLPSGMGFHLIVDYGAMIPAMDKLRSMTFSAIEKTSATSGGERPRTVEASPRKAGDERDRPLPQYFRYHQSVVVRSPSGDRVTLYNAETRQTLDLSGPKDAPLEVAPVYSTDILALGLSGRKITRIAVADASTGWHVQDLRRPAEGELSPTVAQGIAVYTSGRHVYAYGVQAHRWDVAELPGDLEAAPVIGPNTASIEGLGHIFTFAARTGRWEHIDVRSILDGTEAPRK